jgi:hypothetical protein
MEKRFGENVTKKVDPQLSSHNDIHQSYSKHFNENYQFSKNLIGKLVERTMNSGGGDEKASNKIVMKFPPPVIQERKAYSGKKSHESFFPVISTDKDMKSNHEQNENPHHHHHPSSLPNDFLEVNSKLSSPPHSKMILQFNHDDIDDDGDCQLPQQPTSPVFTGGQLLPEYSKLKSKISNSKGSIDLSNQNFGNHRIVVFTETLAASAKESEIYHLSLKGNRLTDVGICEIVRQLNCSTHKNLISLDLSSNKVHDQTGLTFFDHLSDWKIRCNHPRVIPQRTSFSSKVRTTKV